ncbi:peptide MFS transporter [Flavobacterium sp. AG291]|uniref:peptide MFS transporter n=1 Tax=Flavobacterium sp. AG291 TaxID=2184000 RepID=UPI000E0CAC05|nr:peptide MFS transporter [Flavobacterium sp. AG291]RDI15868.1 POT family proton-dependent oligopeptide transporter [Flavobacterium sp. AG291]
MSETTTQKGHPKGLWFLFGTEMWERFGYYLMLGIFALYMLDGWNNGGMGFDAHTKSDIYGTYLGLVYLTPFIGGLLADRVLGYRRSIIMGGLMMAAGYFLLSIHDITTFFAGLGLIILGNGFFKPNISTLVGNLYSSDELKHKKDSGYNIFYMGINVGAFVCNFVAAYMRINFGWNFAFIAAGVGMLIGVVIFLSGTKHIKHVDVIKPLQEGDMPTGKILGSTILPMFVFGILGYLIPDNLLGSDTNDAFILGCVPVIAFFIYLWFKSSGLEKRAIAALLAVFSCVILFFAIFHQNGDALTVWAEDYTDREMPESVATVFNKVDMAQTVENNDIVALDEPAFKAKIEELRAANNAMPEATETEMAAKKASAKEIAKLESSRKYFSNLAAEKVPAKGKDLKLYSTELYQSINPFWVIVLTPVLVGIWTALRKKGKEPSTPTKIALGLLITALSALVMVGAVYATNDLTMKAGSWWLLASYGVITLGELCLSPMGLSLVSKLSPPRITALMMGGFFLAISVGNKLAGMLSSLWEDMEQKENFFFLNFALVLVAALLLFLMLKWLNRVMKENNVF